MSTQVTIENRVTVTLTKSKLPIDGGVTSLFWSTLDDLAFIGELWSESEMVRLAVMTRAFADSVDPVTQYTLTAEHRDHILTQKLLRAEDRSVGGGIFFGPKRVDFPLADPEQEIGGLLAYSAISSRMLFLLRANPGSFTGAKPIRTTFASGIYAQVRA